MSGQNTEVWLFVLGGACALIGSMAVVILNLIKDQIKDVNKSMQDLNHDLREGVSGLDRRLTVIEERVNGPMHQRCND